MNNQEAIKSLENIVEYWTCRPTEAEAAKLAISALETIDLLQKRGLDVERLKNLDYHKEIVQRINFEDYMELKDEVEELREKQVPKKLLEIRKRRDFNDNVVSIIGNALYARLITIWIIRVYIASIAVRDWIGVRRNDL